MINICALIYINQSMMLYTMCVELYTHTHKHTHIVFMKYSIKSPVCACIIDMIT